MNDSSATLKGEHPYFPPSAVLPGYAVNTMDAATLVACFVAGSGAILTTAYTIISRARPGLARSDILAALWFVLCGFIHFFFEGYFAFNYDNMPAQLDLFGQLWKEYSLSDSRYLTQDSFVVTMEAATAIFWGPLSFLCALFIVMDHPLRHPLQLIISLGQMYGDVLYYATATFAVRVEGVDYCRPESFYFWWYYFLCNAFWIVIPFALIVQSVAKTRAAFVAMQAAAKTKKGQ
ncbi:3-beta-hydroxysteroid-Delta(8),Delta(7)-isomerase-like protein [Hapsidospora chrysogenum ATCC 11550]|uniref:3-beta-hydroxysteroid-Delta(8), Delta(7)-isomerase-like protein n=1 Tax=Hapsidospora chrysogenum (strain ATCC 11550 / CBS 779.69 / DSM 880 / IAM 14645 / JCM 23072 / IMI 49137) TaxID=857340 RepID=A0A086TFR5_HAPC1|nr:3-beta-hydroxysteroid-Delta(8),Delta(7)-isomerase-like protein [Hapsidospora chrysogenum ATCC 11550]